MLRHQPIEINLSIHSLEYWAEQQLRHNPKLFEISLVELGVEVTNILLTLDIATPRCSLTCWGALELHLTEHQC